jgi:Dolichyl-phosphate-mannose-protein mannosyltransferase
VRLPLVGATGTSSAYTAADSHTWAGSVVKVLTRSWRVRRESDLPRISRSVLAGVGVHQIAAVGLAATATVLRLGALDLVPFKLDEVDALSRTRALVDHGVLPATGGHMSWGVPDPPLVIYLLALPAALTRDAALAAAFMGMLDLIAVVLAYRLGAQSFGKTVGLAAGLLYATCPWAVYFARDVWVNIVPAFTAIALFAAVHVVARRRRRWALVFFLAIGAQAQTHLLAVVYLIPVLLTIALSPRRWLSPFSLLGLGLALLVSAPYVLGRWEQRDELVATIQAQLGSLQSTPVSALELSLWAVTGFHIQDLLGDGQTRDYEVFAAALGVVYAAVCVLVAIGTARCLAATVRRVAGWEAYPLLLFWAWSPVVLMTMADAALSLHYFTLLYPALFLIVGLGLHGPGLLAWRAPARLFAAVAPPVLVAIAATQTAALVGLTFGVWSSIAGYTREVATRSVSSDVRGLTRGTEIPRSTTTLPRSATRSAHSGRTRPTGAAWGGRECAPMLECPPCEPDHSGTDDELRFCRDPISGLAWIHSGFNVAVLA